MASGAGSPIQRFVESVRARLRVCRCLAGEKYAGLLSVNLDWGRLQELLASIESRLEGAATKDSLNAVRATRPGPSLATSSAQLTPRPTQCRCYRRSWYRGARLPK